MARQLVHAEDILDDAAIEKSESYERECNKEYLEALQSMGVEVRETLENMFEIVKRHERTNKNIKKDLHVSIQALQSHHANTEAYTNYRDVEAYNNKVKEMTNDKRSLFTAEKQRYHRRHYIRIQYFKNLLEKFERYLDQPLLMNGAREKVLDLRKIQKFKNGNALAQIKKWDLTFDDETFDQLQVVDSTLVSDDAYKNMMRKNY